MPAFRPLSAATALAALLACGGSTEPAPSAEFTLRLTTDSAYVYESSGSCGLYCFRKVPSAGTMTARLTFGRRTSDLSPPVCCLGTIVTAFADVQFADSLSGKAVVDTDGTVTVAVGLPARADRSVPTDYFTLTGRITNGRYAGRWQQTIDPHGLANFGSFVTVP